MKKVTPIQIEALVALDPEHPSYDPSHRPRGSLERLAKKGLVGGNRKIGWHLTHEGKAYLLRHGIVAGTPLRIATPDSGPTHL